MGQTTRRHGERRSCSRCGRKKPAGRGRQICNRCKNAGATIVPKQDRREIVRLYTVEGLSMGAISARVFWNYSTVNRILHLEGVQVRPMGPNVTPRRHKLDDLQETVELYMSGLTDAQVGERLGITPSAVTARLESAGVDRRSRGESIHLRRLGEIAAGGRAALTDRQAQALAILERDGKVASADIARELRAPGYSTRQVLRQLKSFGLVDGKRTPHGKARPTYWWRTDLALADVLREYLRPPLAPGLRDDRLPAEPLRDWIEDLVARERRALLYTAVTDQRHGHDPENDKKPESIVRKRLGIDTRTFHRLRKEQDNVTFGLADRILQNAGGPRMEELWPELERELEEAA